MRQPSELQVCVIEGSDEYGFADDVCRALSATAARAGHDLLFAPSAEPGVQIARVTEPAISGIRHLLGRHRAQVAPVGAPYGRMRTLLVSARLVGAESAEVVATYSYPTGSVVLHGTGERVRLPVFLGEAEDLSGP